MSVSSAYTEKYVIASRALQVGDSALTTNYLKNYDGMTTWTPTAVVNITMNSTTNCQYILYDAYVTVNLDFIMTTLGMINTFAITGLPYKSTDTNALNTNLICYLAIENLNTNVIVRANGILDTGTSMVINTLGGGVIAGSVQHRVTGQFTYRFE